MCRLLSLRLLRPLALCTPLFWLGSLAPAAPASPPAGKGACLSDAREKYRSALADCRKQPFGLGRRACQARADRENERDRAACRKYRK